MILGDNRLLNPENEKLVLKRAILGLGRVMN